MKTYFCTLLLILSGCQPMTPGDNNKTTDKISESQALIIAKTRFEKLYPDRMDQYKISISGDIRKGFWDVSFDGTGKYAVPGGYVSILVSKSTGELQVLPSD